jgi:tetratricopeptide (TPR) repeat protein
MANAHYGLAEIDMGSGAHQSAIEHYRQALALDSTSVAYVNNLAFALIEAGQEGEAVPVLRKGLQRFPGAAQLHKNLGLAYLKSGSWKDAIEAFDAALDRDASLASAWGLRAETRARMRDFPGARRDWNIYLGMLYDEAERPVIEAQLQRLGALPR